jgi:hypothetical protein
MNLRRWVTNPIVIAAAVEFAIITVIVVLVLNRN